MNRTFLSIIVFCFSFCARDAFAVDSLPVPPSVLPGAYADPNAVYMDGKFYIYPTTDGYPSWSSDSFTAWCSVDLKHWKNLGVLLNLKTDISWAHGHAWAPTIAEKNGRYYFYFVADGNIGVAVAPHPWGPFKDELGKPLVKKGMFSGQMIDPAVFRDDDGSYYLYFGQGTLYGVKLHDDMQHFDSVAVRSFHLPDYNEGPFMIKRHGLYYIMWSEFDTRDPRYSVWYAVGKNPLGPFVKSQEGPVLSSSGLIQGTGHHSVVQVPRTDQWYIVYHRFIIPGGNGYNREVCISPLHFTRDGKILPVDVWTPIKPVSLERK